VFIAPLHRNSAVRLGTPRSKHRFVYCCVMYRVSRLQLLHGVKTPQYSRPKCHVVSKTFSISRNTAAVQFLGDVISHPHTLKYLNCDLIDSQNYFHLVSFFPYCFWTVLEINFAISLPIVDKRLIGRKFWGNLKYFQGFGSYDNYFFPRCRKVTKPKAVIKKFVKCLREIGRWQKNLSCWSSLYSLRRDRTENIASKNSCLFFTY
jgi:hypothetical protein